MSELNSNEIHKYKPFKKNVYVDTQYNKDVLIAFLLRSIKLAPFVTNKFQRTLINKKNIQNAGGCAAAGTVMVVTLHDSD